MIYSPGVRRRAAIAVRGCILLAATCLCLGALPAGAATIVVNSTADTRADDGVCTLREAIIAANTNTASGPTAGECEAGSALPTIDIIQLSNISGSPDLFTLAIGGRDEDGGATGDLDLTESVTVRGDSMSETIVQAGTTAANGIDRVFDVVQGGVPIAVAFENLTIRHGRATVPAGGVVASAQGGGIYVRAVPSGLASALTVTDAAITVNTAAGNGGGIAVAGGFGAAAPSLTLVHADVSSNTAALGGGGILCSACTLSIAFSAVLSNTAQVAGGIGYGGGGLRITGDGLSTAISNSTIGDNRSNVDGGGAAIPVGTATAQFTFATLYLNRADFDANVSGTGGGLRNVTGTVQVSRSIVAGNLRAASTASDCNGTVTSVGYNVLGTAGSCVAGGTATVTTADAKLSPLDYHGGTTRNYAPIVGSPALARITAVQCTSSSDQRGFVRPVASSCESGAIENSRPTVVADDASMMEDAGPQGFPFTVNDFETPATLIITATSSVTALVPNANLGVSGSGASRTLTATALPDQSGSTQITVTADDGDAPGTDPFTLTVLAVNDAPTLAALATPVTIAEDAAAQIVNLTGISAGGGESQTLTVTATSNNTGLIPHPTPTYTSPNTTGSIAYAPVANAIGSATITVTVTDSGGGTDTVTRSFLVNVTAVNDAPTLDAIASPVAIAEGAGPQTVNLTGITAGGGTAESGETLTVTATSDTHGLIADPTVTYASPDATGSLSYTPVADANGTAIVTVTVTDDGGGTSTFSRQFTVTVTSVNDDPAISNIPDQQVPASTSAAIPFTAGDLETAHAALSIGATSSNEAVVPNTGLVVNNSGPTTILTLTPVANTTGTATITVTVTDADGGTAVDTFVATVVPNLTIGDATVTEGDSGSVNLTFTVALAGSSATPVSVTYTTAQRTAIAGMDYAHATGTVTFSPTVTGPSTFTVAVNGDTATEIDETFVVNLSGATGGAVVTDAQGVGTITDDDATTDRTAEFASWARRIGVTASGGSLTKTGVIGWNAGASSTKALLTGNGSVEVSAAATDQIVVVGLSRGDTNTNFTDVDFSIELYTGARYYIVEGGVFYPGIFGSYAPGDRFAVTVTGGVVSYQKNGVTIYTSGVVPIYPLLVDTALYSPGGAVVDVVIAGELGRPVTWTNLVGAMASGSTLTKTAAAGWNAGAASTRALVSGDGAVEFRTPETSTQRILGLSRDNATTDFSDIDFGILAASNGTFYVFEGGVSRGLFGSYAADDRFQVAIESGQVVYRRNGALFYTSAVAPVYPLLVDTALFTPGATLADVFLTGTFAADAAFGPAAGAAATGNTLTKTAAAGWNAGAISTRAIVKGNGFLEFTTNGDPTQKVAGLSHGNTTTDFSDVDFGILLASNGTVYVFEAGTSRGVFGTYRAGDRFRVAVEAGVVTYRRNGVLLYTSAVAPVYPLLVDTALYSPSATVADVVLAGDLGEAVAWTAAVRVSASPGLLTKTGALGWNAGAISTRAIASGDGFVSFMTSEATTHKLGGLSTGNTNTDFADVDFGILLASNGTVYVFESGTSRGVFGAYAAGDQFHVAVKGGVVQYLKNGKVFYTSGVTPSYPLLVDTALFTPGATLTDVMLGCVTAGCQ